MFFSLGYSFLLVKDFIFNSKDSNYLLSLPFSFTEIMWARIIFLFYNTLPIVFLSVGGLCHFYLEDKISILVSLYALWLQYAGLSHNFHVWLAFFYCCFVSSYSNSSFENTGTPTCYNAIWLIHVCYCY